MSKMPLQALSLASLLILALSACAPTISATEAPATSVPERTQVPTAKPAETQLVSSPAQVQAVEVQVLGGDPPLVYAILRGDLSESCATLGPSQVQYSGNTIQISVDVISPADRGCAPASSLFESAVALDVRKLPPGPYTVSANGVSTSFTLGSPTPPPIPAATQTISAPPAPTRSGCADAAAFVSDVTIPDYTVLAPNTAFTKTWRLKNTGSCTWDSDYLVSYISGTTMSQQPGYWIVPQGQTVPPGGTVDVSVGMTSPVQNGDYGSYWGLKRQSGPLVPIQGGAGGNSFYVKIRVSSGGGGSGGQITNASIDIELEQGSGTACTAAATYFVRAYITSNGPATASYEIESSAGQIPAGYFQVGSSTALNPVDYGNVVFDQAGTQTVYLRFVGPYPYPDDITVMLRVNGGDWHNTKLSCGG
jgi:hypothetical protein